METPVCPCDPMVLDINELGRRLEALHAKQQRELLTEASTAGGRELNALEQEPEESEGETHRRLASQLLVPYFLAGLGMVAAGLCLDVVQTWPVFANVPDFMILIPPLLGLKGSVELTFASRLSMKCNSGQMKSTNDKIKLIMGNLAVMQCQAIMLSFLACVFTVMVTYLIVDKWFQVDRFLLLCAATVFTASVTTFVTGCLGSGAVVVCQMLKIDPSNVVIQLVAGLGDLVTVAILAATSSILYSSIDPSDWVCFAIIVILASTYPLWNYVMTKIHFNQQVLYNTRMTVLVAAGIQMCAGLVLYKIIQTNKGALVFLPVVNGVAANLVTLQVDKLASTLRRTIQPGRLPCGHSICMNPCDVFCSNRYLAVVTRVLMCFLLPGHVASAYLVSFGKYHEAVVTPAFIALYIVSVFILMVFLLDFATVLTSYFWVCNQDPVGTAIPYLTATADIVGICFLGLMFELLKLMGDPMAHAP